MQKHLSTVLLSTLLLYPALALAQAPTAPADETLDLPVVTPGPVMSLADLLAAVDQRNLTLASVRAEIDKSDRLLSLAWSQVYPMVLGSLQYLHNDHQDTVDFSAALGPLMQGLGQLLQQNNIPLPDMSGQSTTIRTQEDLKGIIQARVPLVNSQSWYNIAAARRGVSVAKAAVEDARQQLLMSTAQGYYLALMARSLIDLNEAQVKSASHHLRIARARLEAGAGMRIDVLRADTSLEQYRQDLLAAHLAFDTARDALSSMAGSDDLLTPEDPPAMAVPDADSDTLVKQALQRRSDLALRRANVALAQTQVSATNLFFLPTVDAVGQLMYQFTKPPDMGSSDRSRWSILLSLSLPIYNQGTFAGLEQRRSILRQAILQEQDAASTVRLAVRKARRDYLSALSSVTSAERQAKLAGEALTLIDNAYKAGTSTSLDVTDARRTLSSASVNLASMRLKAQIALLSLLRAIGEDMGKLGAR